MFNLMQCSYHARYEKFAKNLKIYLIFYKSSAIKNKSVRNPTNQICLFQILKFD